MNAIARELRENPLLWLLAAVPAVFAAERVAAGEEESTWPLPVAGALLVGVTVLVALVSEIFVESVQFAAEAFGMTPAFVTNFGRSTWYVGVLLLVVYATFALTLYLMPPATG